MLRTALMHAGVDPESAGKDMDLKQAAVRSIRRASRRRCCCCCCRRRCCRCLGRKQMAPELLTPQGER